MEKIIKKERNDGKIGVLDHRYRLIDSEFGKDIYDTHNYYIPDYIFRKFSAE